MPSQDYRRQACAAEGVQRAPRPPRKSGMDEQPGDKVSPDGIVLPGVGMIFMRKTSCVPSRAHAS